MNVMGIYLKSNLLRIVTLSGSKQEHCIIEPKFHKIEIPKDNDIDSIKLVQSTLIAFYKNNKIEAIGINGRTTRGQAAGGPLSFKSEGVLLASSSVQIKSIFSATTRASDRKRPENKTNKPSTIDLGKAYDIAFEMLPE